MALSEETTRHGALDRDLAPETDVLLAGRYRLGARIGSGSTGVVHRAEDVMFSRPVAVRLVHPALARDDETLARIEGRLHSNAHMLRDDVRALNDLIDVIDLGRTDDGRIFVVTDLLPATENLADQLAREGPLAWRRLRRLAVRACQIIHLSHEHGVVRQDLQTRNLFPVRDKSDAAVLRIYSPGLGVAFGEQLWSCLDPEEALQLARYAAPEQISGGQIDRRTDVYALGVILYEALTGQVPYPDPRPSYVLASHLLSRPPPFPPDVRRRGVTPELEAIVMRALAKAPDDRWPDVKALANAMAAIEFGPSEKSGVLETADVADLTELLEPAPSATTMRIDRRRLSGKPGLGLGPGPVPAAEVDPSASTSELAWREILEAAESAVGAVVAGREPDARGPSGSGSDGTAPDESTPTLPFGAADHSAPRWPAPASAAPVALTRRRRAAPWAVAAALALVTAGGVSYLLRPEARSVAPTQAAAARTDTPRDSAPALAPVATRTATPPPAAPAAAVVAPTPTPAPPEPTPTGSPPIAPTDPGEPAVPTATAAPGVTTAAPTDPSKPDTPAAAPAKLDTPAAAPTDAAQPGVPTAVATDPAAPAEPAEPAASTPAAPAAASPVPSTAPSAAKRLDPTAEPKKPRKRERTVEPTPPPRKAAPGTALPDRSGHELPDPAAAQPAP